MAHAENNAWAIALYRERRNGQASLASREERRESELPSQRVNVTIRFHISADAASHVRTVVFTTTCCARYIFIRCRRGYRDVPLDARVVLEFLLEFLIGISFSLFL